MATVQYRIQIDESLVIELDEMAQEFDEPSGQQIAGRIIRQFLPTVKLDAMPASYGLLLRYSQHPI